MNENGLNSKTFKLQKTEDYKKFRAMLIIESLKVGDFLNKFISEFVQKDEFRNYVQKLLTKENGQ